MQVVVFVIRLTVIFFAFGGIKMISAQNMVRLSGGTFRMGDTEGVGRTDEQPVRPVTLNPFYLGAFEVTFAQYDEFCRMTGAEFPEDNGWGRNNQPVINISWYDALLYCNWLSNRQGLRPVYLIEKLVADTAEKSFQDTEKWTVIYNFDADGYRLPTEAEWEFAAQGSYTGNPDSSAWYIRNAKVMPRPTRTKRPTVTGFYDLGGNVSEWCFDRYRPQHPPAPSTGPTGPQTGDGRVVKGGSWEDGPYELRPSARRHFPAHLRNLSHVGFRLARNG